MNASADVDNRVSVAEKFQALRAIMDERTRRWWAATEARAWGHGGILRVAEATGMSRDTIAAGLKELRSGAVKQPNRIRREGGGRKRLTETQPRLKKALEELVEPSTRGDPQSPLRWTCKSLRMLAKGLEAKGYKVGFTTVGQLLAEEGYSLQANRKTIEGAQHPDRNAQFEFIAAKTKLFQRRGQPVISVDTKKKELIGDFKNGGLEWQPPKSPIQVKTHDFPDKNLGKAIPYGVYDLANNLGWVNVGIDHDTPEFAVESIYRWWKKMGRRIYPKATELLITADAGGSNSYRAGLWKVELQRLANETHLGISVCHFPPGTSKWNKIEHRLFCHITENWRGRPLVNHEVVVNLIANTTTTKGLKIKAELDTGQYFTGLKPDKEDLKTIRLKPDSFHGDWNYTVIPDEFDKKQS